MDTLNNFDLKAWSDSTNETNTPATNEQGCVGSQQGEYLSSETSETDILDLVRKVIERGVSITVGYENWRNVGFALVHSLGEGGRQAFHDLSSMDSCYVSRECDRQYNACLRSSGTGITSKTLFKLAGDAGIDLSEFAREHMHRPSPEEDFRHLQTKEVCANNDNVPFGSNKENMGKNNVFDVFENNVQEDTLAQVAQTGKTFCDKIDEKDLCQFCIKIIESQSDWVGKDKMLLGALNLVSGIIPKTFYSVYDRRRIYAPLYNILFGGFATKKGDLEVCKHLIVPIKTEMRRRYEAQKQDYEQQLMAWEAAPKGSRGKSPEEPVLRSPFVPANSSASAIYRALDANEGWGVMFETEADTLTNMLSKSEYGDYSDLLRKAHHHESAPMVRVSEHLNIELEEPRLSVLLTCTGSQLPLLLPSANVSNGLASRFLFYGLPDSKVEFRNVFEGCDEPIEDLYRGLGQQVLALYHALLDRNGHPIQFLMTKTQQQVFVSTFNEVLNEQFSMLGNGIQGFIFRLALECYRYTMVLTLLRRLSERFGTGESLFDDDEQALVCDERDFRVAMTIINCLVNHTGRVYAVIGGKDEDPFAKVADKPSEDLKKYYKALPEGREFRTAEAMEVARSLGIAERTAKRMLGGMVTKYLVLDHLQHGVYVKVRKEATV